ncbi:gamma-aminobutyric acid type B receptor subunit 2-like [Asterias rubens]|uniref:gamma-aminobutyric acid type B receptor subunit 2-like n=1 Tax=Asterias rubens TaxID=7604 RepID=UPI0014550078|nr:gamma-aminobutyric acid type B receptor subunit 2-like [Asterias rubens]
MVVCLKVAVILFTGICSITCAGSSAKKPLYIGGLLPLSEADGWSRFFGYSAKVGAELAVIDINNRSDVLPDYNLVLDISDSEADQAVALNRLYELLYSPPVKVAIFGPLLSGTTEIVAQVIAKWDIIQMSPGASTPVLTDRVKYPHTYRTLTSSAAFAAAELQIIHKFGWTKIATFHQAREPHIGRTNEFLKLAASDENISVVSTETFYNDPLEALQRLKTKDVRIIVTSFFEEKARKIFCDILKLELYGANYVWIMPGYFDDEWKAKVDEEIDCSVDDLKRATEGYLTVTYSFYGVGTNVGRCGKTPEEFRREMADALGYNVSVATRGSAALGYDAIWSLAMAMHEAEAILSRSLDSYQYGDEEYARVVGQNILGQSFDGMSGRVVFHEGGYRIGNLLIEQNIGGNEELVGTYNNIDDEVSWHIPTDNLWYYNGGRPPYDSDVTKKVDDLQSTPIAIMVVVSILVAMGMILSLMFLAFNFWKRKNRQIKMSSPRVNNLIASGIMLAYLCVVLLGVDRSMVDIDALQTICRVRSWLMPVAFTLAFGGMFTKMWRVYSIVIANKTKRKVIKDRHLVGIIAILLLVDFAILVPWQIIDPIHIEEIRTPVPQTKEDKANYTKHELLYVNCTSFNNTIWTMAMLIYKAFVVVFGAFLAWSTRNVKVSGLNDSYYVGLSIYNTVICCVVAVPLSFLAVSSIGVTFALVSGFLLFCITASLCMLFFPKVIAVYRKNAIEDETFTGIRFNTTISAPRPPKGTDIPSTSAQVESRSTAQ